MKSKNSRGLYYFFPFASPKDSPTTTSAFLVVVLDTRVVIRCIFINFYHNVSYGPASIAHKSMVLSQEENFKSFKRYAVLNDRWMENRL